MTFKTLSCATACAFSFYAAPAFACSAHVCQLPSDWLSQGLASHPDSTSASLRYDYALQNQLRQGGDAVNRATLAVPNPQEIEERTANHAVTVTVNHSFGQNWIGEIQVPFSSRPHSTISEGEIESSRSRTGGLGDVRMSVRYQGFGGRGVTGVEVGLKLPTGAFNQVFRSGPEVGQPVDRGLQPGSGTTHATFAVYHFDNLSEKLAYLLETRIETPLGRRNLYKPAVAVSGSVGISYLGWSGLTPQMQLNFRASGRDHGFNADTQKSGGEQLYLTPGLSARLSGSTILFGTAQVPLYQRVNGYQITPRFTLSLGAQHKF